MLVLATHMLLPLVNMTPKPDPLGEEVSRTLRLDRPFTVFLDVYVADEVEELVMTTEDSLIFDENDR